MLAVPLLSAGVTLAGDRPCPTGQGGRLGVPSVPWNLGGGVDSDGCAYALDAEGKLRVLGLDVVDECLTCGGAFLVRPLGGVRPGGGSSLPKDEVRALAAGFRQERGLAGQARLSAAARLELAARCYERFGPRLGVAAPEREALVGRLLLRAAWAARGEAVLAGPDAGFRPRSLAEVDEQLAALDARHDADAASAPEVRAIERSLSDLGRVRATLEAGLAEAAPAERFRRLGAQLSLDRLEVELYARKEGRLAELARQQPLDRQQLSEARVRAWIRAGERRRWRRALEGAQEPSAQVAARACAEEQRLLGLAQGFLRRAGEQSADLSRSALLLFLAGDAARRLGQESVSRALYAKVLSLAHDDEVGRRAAHLLGS